MPKTKKATTDKEKLSAKIDKKKIKKVDELSKEMISLMGVDASLEVYEDKDNNAIRVDIKSEEEQGLLIGKRGETLSSIQTLLGMMVKNEFNEWVRVIINVGDWREKERQYLENLAIQTADRAKETGKPQELYNLTPSQRRIVHLVLSEVKGIVTESSGEGNQRFLVVSSK